MKLLNCLYVIVSILVSGCVAPYAYVSASKDDPQIVFGERSGDIGTRAFNINSTDAVANKCRDFKNVGGVSNSNRLLDKNKTIRVPAGQAIAVRSLLSYTGATCQPGVRMFTPESNGKYSVDIGQIGNMCYLSIARIEPSGKVMDVQNASVLPECK